MTVWLVGEEKADVMADSFVFDQGHGPVRKEIEAAGGTVITAHFRRFMGQAQLFDVLDGLDIGQGLAE